MTGVYATTTKSGYYTTVVNNKMSVSIEKVKQSCPHCEKKVLHLKQHIKNMHTVLPSAPPLPPPTVDLLAAPEPEPIVVAAPAPPPEKETFAAVAAKVIPPMVAYTRPIMPPLFRQPVEKNIANVDSVRVVNNIFKFGNRANPGKRSEWMLLVALWLDTPERFQITKPHIGAGNTVPRITMTVWRDELRENYCQYHIYMNPSAFAIATHIDGHDSGVSYRLIEFMSKL